MPSDVPGMPDPEQPITAPAYGGHVPVRFAVPGEDGVVGDGNVKAARPSL